MYQGTDRFWKDRLILLAFLPSIFIPVGIYHMFFEDPRNLAAQCTQLSSQEIADLYLDRTAIDAGFLPK